MRIAMIFGMKEYTIGLQWRAKFGSNGGGRVSRRAHKFENLILKIAVSGPPFVSPIFPSPITRFPFHLSLSHVLPFPALSHHPFPSFPFLFPFCTFSLPYFPFPTLVYFSSFSFPSPSCISSSIRMLPVCGD